jgi:hypothetical protein
MLEWIDKGADLSPIENVFGYLKEQISNSDEVYTSKE